MTILLYIKGSLPSGKKRKREYNWLQNIDYDPRPTKHRKVHSFKAMKTFTNNLNVKVSTPPVILSLLKKHYLPTAGSKGFKKEPEVLERNCGIMKEKLEQFVKQTTMLTPDNFLSFLSFTNEEIGKIDKETVDQWKCKSWFIAKKGFISASKCKSIVTRQTTLEKSNVTLVTAVAKSIVSDPLPIFNSKTMPENPQNPRDWGLKHEESARNAYMHVQNHVHYKLKLKNHGFIICKDKPFLGASVDNVRSCECSSDCKEVVVEYKCPWTHRLSDAKEAFLSPEIGGMQVAGHFQLKTTSKYYHQVQMQMFVLCLLSCDFVIWTTKGILTVEIAYNVGFMNAILLKLEKFWISQIAPLLIAQVSGNVPVQNQGNTIIYLCATYIKQN